MTDNITDIETARFEREWERMEAEFAEAMARAPHVVRWNDEEAS